jgi:hypothetical protein
VPAVVVPVVLLAGFAGCHLFFHAEPSVLPRPEGLVATPISVSEISLSWVIVGTPEAFEIQRAADGGSPEQIGVVSTPPFVDPPNFGTPAPLEPGITYNYQVFAINGGLKSEGSEIARARPLAFQFDLSTPASTNDGGFGGDCIVQRLSASLLKNWGTVVTIRVRGSTDSDLTINGIFISRAARAGAPANPNPDAYDADTDLTMIAAGVVVPANTSVELDLANPYTIPDPPEDLLIAFDIGSVPGQGRVRRAPLAGAVGFTKNVSQQAALPDRSPNPADPAGTYNTAANELFLLESIAVS